MAVFEVLALVGTAALLLTYWLKLKSSKFKGIPEPPCNFLLGHALCLTGAVPKTFLEWSKSVGPVFQVRVFNFRALVLSDKESITKVCSKPEAGGRWRFGVLERITELFGAGVVFGDGQEQREFYLKSLRTVGFGRSKLETEILKEIDRGIQAWRAKKGVPFELEGSASGYAVNAVWQLLGSKRFSAEEAATIAHGTHSAFEMDTLQQRLNVIFTKPMEKVSSAARELTRGWGLIVASCNELFESHLKDRIPNEPRDVIDMILDRSDVTKDVTSSFHPNNLKHAFQMPEVLAASIHTTSPTVEWFLVYLGKHLQVQKKLQMEIDQVVGPTKDQPVQLHFRDQMPYAQACIYETLRMSSVAPFSAPHAALQDFEFQGAVIPKGTIILPNLYALHHDPEIWDRPEEFNPERFLTPEGRFDTSVAKNVMPFGVGRRTCIGSSVVMDMLFLFVTNVYKEFEVRVPNCPENVEGRIGFDILPPAGLQVQAVLRMV